MNDTAIDRELNGEVDGRFDGAIKIGAIFERWRDTGAALPFDVPQDYAVVIELDNGGNGFVICRGKKAIDLPPASDDNNYRIEESIFRLYFKPTGRVESYDSLPQAAEVVIKLYDDVMLDIETLATHTSMSPMLSFALVPFKMVGERIDFGPRHLVILELSDQIAEGRVIDPATQKWWGRQTKAAREHWANPDYRLTSGTLIRANVNTIDLARIWSMMGMTSTARVWANGIVFDVGNMENYIGMNVPWGYNAARDMRTVYRHLPKKRERPAPSEADVVGHDPISDCVQQIWSLWEVWPNFDPDSFVGDVTARDS